MLRDARGMNDQAQSSQAPSRSARGTNGWMNDQAGWTIKLDERSSTADPAGGANRESWSCNGDLEQQARVRAGPLPAKNAGAVKNKRHLRLRSSQPLSHIFTLGG